MVMEDSRIIQQAPASSAPTTTTQVITESLEGGGSQEQQQPPSSSSDSAVGASGSSQPQQIPASLSDPRLSPSGSPPHQPPHTASSAPSSPPTTAATTISLHVREATPSNDADIDADDESTPFPFSPLAGTGVTVSSRGNMLQRYPQMRRERSYSTVSPPSNPYMPGVSPALTTSSTMASGPSSNLHLEMEPKIKRRSISTIGPLDSISPPSKTLRADELDDLKAGGLIAAKPPLSSAPHHLHHRRHHHHHHRHRFGNGQHQQQVQHQQSLPRYPYVDPVITAMVGSKRSSSASSGYRCHHMIAEENNDEARKVGETGGDEVEAAASGDESCGKVQRAHSNPEVEACPVCTARKECEILLKRTYSKVSQRSRVAQGTKRQTH